MKQELLTLIILKYLFSTIINFFFKTALIQLPGNSLQGCQLIEFIQPNKSLIRWCIYYLRQIIKTGISRILTLLNENIILELE